jgi:RNA recognition motif-containing protein
LFVYELYSFAEGLCGKGTVLKGLLIKDKGSDTNRGFGFLTFKKKADAEKFIKLCKENKFKERIVKIEYEKEKGYKFEKPQKKQKNTTVMVRGLSYSVNLKNMEEAVKERFSKHGVVKNVRIPAHKEDKTRHRGYCFVDFENEKCAKVAVEKQNNNTLEGNQIICDLKLEREEYLEQKNLILQELENNQNDKNDVKDDKDKESFRDEEDDDDINDFDEDEKENKLDEEEEENKLDDEEENLDNEEEYEEEEEEEEEKNKKSKKEE